jgi:Dyp-type peroxidase family
MNLADVQGNVLHGYTLEQAAYLFVALGDAAAGRRWLGELVPRVTSGARGSAKPARTLNLALTHAGLRALEVDEAALDDLPEDFRAPMASRARALGDVGPSAPERWDAGLGTGEAHVLVTLYAGTPAERDALLAAVEERVDGDPALRVVHRQRAGVLEGAREHFGYADGFSQPAVEGSGRNPRGEGVKRRLLGWRHIRLGELLLGHRDEDGVVAGADAALLRDGTFMVWRKLAQDVAGFRRWLAELAGEDPLEQERVAAKLVGRWREGESLVESPDRPAPTGKDNAFTYRRDRRGLACPLGAHVRRANPRDALGWRTERTRRHRLVRRGMPYGPPLPDAVREDDGRERGLVFVGLNASISRQFELVQGHWLLDGDAFGLGGEQDMLLAPEDPRGKMTVPGRPPRFLAPQRQLVTTRGGEYLFVPSMAVLRELSGQASTVQVTGRSGSGS